MKVFGPTSRYLYFKRNQHFVLPSRLIVGFFGVSRDHETCTAGNVGLFKKKNIRDLDQLKNCFISNAIVKI